MAYYATDIDLKAIDTLDLCDRADALYYYLIKGWSMAEVGSDRLDIDSDQPGRIVSSLTRAYGFTGKNGGKYNIYRDILTEDAMEDLLDNYIFWPSYENGCLASGEFDRIVREYVQEQRQRRQRSQPRPPQPPKPPTQTYRPPQPPQPSPWELEQQERQRREQEEAQKKQAENTANSLLQQARSALSRNDLQTAHDLLLRAQKLRRTWDGDALLAECLARAGNAGSHASEIITLLTEHFEGYEKKEHSMTPTANQYLWRAGAYLAQGNKTQACDDYFRAADIYYEKGDYVNADRLYTECRNKTGYYSGNTPLSAFRVAFAREKGKTPLTEADHDTCIHFYREAVKNKQQKDYALANMSWHLRMLGDDDGAIEAAEQAMELGLHDEYVYNYLFWAQLSNEDWEDAESTLNFMKYRNYRHTEKRKVLYDKWLRDLLLMSEHQMLELIERLEWEKQEFEPWLKGACLTKLNEGREAEGVALLKAQLQKDPCHMDALYHLLFTNDVISNAEQLSYGNRYLKAYSEIDKTKYDYVSEGHRDLVKELVKSFEALEAYRLEEEERKRKEAEEAERRRIAAEEAERRRREAEDAERKRKEAEEARLRQIAAEEAERRRREAEEAERKRKAAEEAERKRKEAEEAERRRREAEEAEKLRVKQEEEALLLLIL